MKKLVLALFAMATFGTLQTHAETVKAPLWDCALTFQAEGGGAQLIFGHFVLNGTGQISCVDVLGNTQVIPVQIRVGGQPVALKAAIGYFKIAGAATGVGIAGQPSDLLGDYGVAGIDAALAVGGGANLSLHQAHSAVTLNGAVQATTGIGLNLGFDYLQIRAL